MGEKLTDIFMELFCEKNSDGTKNLRLKGKELYQRIGKRLTHEDMKKVAIFLDDHPEIVRLDLCYNNIGDKGIQVLVDDYLSYGGNTIEHLNLASCDLTVRGMDALCSTAETLRLKTLRLNGNELGFVGARRAADLLGKCPTLRHFDLGDTGSTLGTAHYLVGIIYYSKESQLQILDFSRVVPACKTDQCDPAYLADILGDMIKVNKSIVELHLQKNEFDGHDVELLMWGLDKNTTLLLLDLGFNRIGDHGAEIIARWLKKRPPLLGLNISGNGIGDLGARAFSFGLPYSKVRLLDITYNRIGNIGMRDFLYSIKKPFMLRIFYFWGNTFDEPTFKVIERLLHSGVLFQEQIDIKLYTVDKVLYGAYYPSNHYKHRYYCVMDHGCPVELRIKRNTVEHEFAKPKALVKFAHYDRFPVVDESLPLEIPPCYGTDED